MALEIAHEVLRTIVADAARGGTQEVCGLLMGNGLRIHEARPCANVHPTPQTHFEIDPRALIDAHRAERAGGPELIGFYHSHPRGPCEPSATDRAHAARDGKVWAIVAEGRVRFWRDAAGGFEPLSYTLVES